MAPNRFPSPCVEWNPALNLDDLHNASFQWAHLLRKTVGGIPALSLPRMTGAIFSGPQGNGRHITAEGLAGTIKRLGFQYFLRITGCTMDTEDVADACAVIDSVAGELERRGRLCLLVDSPEESRHSLAIQEYLYQLVSEYKGNLFLILITSDPSNICPVLLRQYTLCHCPKPDLKARQKWFESVMKGRYPINIDSMDHFSMARETEGFSWRQLTDLRSMLRRTIAVKYLNNPEAFNPGLLENEDQIWNEGKVHLTKNEVFQLLANIRSQNTQLTQAPGQPQYVVAQATGTAAALPNTQIPAAEPEPMSEEDAQKLIDHHKNTENMSIDDLFNIDGL